MFTNFYPPTMKKYLSPTPTNFAPPLFDVPTVYPSALFLLMAFYPFYYLYNRNTVHTVHAVLMKN